MRLRRRKISGIRRRGKGAWKAADLLPPLAIIGAGALLAALPWIGDEKLCIREKEERLCVAYDEVREGEGGRREYVRDGEMVGWKKGARLCIKTSDGRDFICKERQGGGGDVLIVPSAKGAPRVFILP